MEPDIDAYSNIMQEIKRRTDVVYALHSKKINVMYQDSHIESIGLQVRMITELVALASLSANKAIFEKNRKKFKKHWHPEKILKDVESLNPNFYPRPIIEVPLRNSRAERELVDMKTGFMNRDELIQVHGRCGDLLHAQNPFGKRVNYDYYEQMLPTWMDRIVKLLNCHMIKLLNGHRFYMVHMKEAGDNQVHIYPFDRIGKASGV